MCDPTLIAAVLEALGYPDEKKEESKKGEVRDEGGNKDNLQNSGEEQK
jgi:hypothetical protein